MGKLKDIRDDLRSVMNEIRRIAHVLEDERKWKMRLDEDRETIRGLQNTITYQSNLINDIIHGIYGQDTTLEFVAIKSYRGKTIVYKDGNRLDTESTRNIDICIDEYDGIDVTIRND